MYYFRSVSPFFRAPRLLPCGDCFGLRRSCVRWLDGGSPTGVTVLRLCVRRLRLCQWQCWADVASHQCADDGAVVATGLIRRVAHRRLLDSAARLAAAGASGLAGGCGHRKCWPRRVLVAVRQKRPWWGSRGEMAVRGSSWAIWLLCFTATCDGGADDDGDAALTMRRRWGIGVWQKTILPFHNLLMPPSVP